VGEETSGWRMPIEKAVANYDEDSVTMAVAAGIDCLSGIDRRAVDGLFFCSTTSPYKEKQAATIVATAIDLRRDLFTADITNCLRSGTTALRMAVDAIRGGSAKQVMVTAADCRMGTPMSDFDRSFGDGAAALLLGDQGVVASVEGSYSVSNEMLDVWRTDGDNFVRSWEDRFIYEEGYASVLPEAVSGLMRKYNLTPKDFAKAVFYAPDARRHREMGARLGFDPAQVQDPLFGRLGNTGTAFAPMLLVAALEEAKPGERILLASYGDGADALVLEVTDHIEKIRDRRGIKGHLASKRILRNYFTYLEWRGLGVGGEAMRGMPRPSASCIWRERDEIIRLYGSRCKSCGTIQYPPQRICTSCHAKDNYEDVRLSDKRAKLFTYSLDYATFVPDRPLVNAIIDFDGGGRGNFMITDREIDSIQVGMVLEMTFRRPYTGRGIHNYYWKCMPVRM